MCCKVSCLAAQTLLVRAICPHTSLALPSLTSPLCTPHTCPAVRLDMENIHKLQLGLDASTVKLALMEAPKLKLKAEHIL